MKMHIILLITAGVFFGLCLWSGRWWVVRVLAFLVVFAIAYIGILTAMMHFYGYY
jgi:hypothetical protein